MAKDKHTLFARALQTFTHGTRVRDRTRERARQRKGTVEGTAMMQEGPIGRQYPILIVRVKWDDNHDGLHYSTELQVIT
jgi:hypothetical protein